MTKPRYKPAGHTQKIPFGDQGIFISCPRGKENNCINDILSILNQYLDEFLEIHGLKDDQALDEPTAITSRDIEDEIQRELAEIKSANAPKKRHFNVLRQSTQCLCLIFLSSDLSKKLSITELIQHIVLSLSNPSSDNKSIVRSRFVQRIYPMQATCSALALLNVESICRSITIDAFSKAQELKSDPLKYRIDITIRNHSAPLTRDIIFDIFRPILHSDLSDISSPVTSALKSQPIASLNAGTADLVIIISVHQNIFGISIVDGKLLDGVGKKFNLQAIAESSLNSASTRTT